MIAQPISNGMRQPQACIVAAPSVWFSTTPSRAAKITATCWLPDCQAT